MKIIVFRMIYMYINESLIQIMLTSQLPRQKQNANTYFVMKIAVLFCFTEIQNVDSRDSILFSFGSTSVWAISDLSGDIETEEGLFKCGRQEILLSAASFNTVVIRQRNRKRITLSAFQREMSLQIIKIFLLILPQN